MDKVRTIIWDCDQVMWFHKKNETEIIAKALGISDTKEFETEFLNMILMFNTYFAKKRVTYKETCKIVEKEMPILSFYSITPEKFLFIWQNLKMEINEFNVDTLDVLEYLRKKEIKSIVKTDWWNEVQIGLMKEYGILEFIEEVHSCNNSFLKCNPLSAEKIIKPGREEEYIMIGDSLNSDICFANNADIKSIWFNKDGKKHNDTIYNTTYEIKSLLEVMEIL